MARGQPVCHRAANLTNVAAGALGGGHILSRSTANEHGYYSERFEQPDEIRHLEKGRFELVHIGGLTIGRALYEPGWRWSEHVGRALGLARCAVEHVGLVVSGAATAAFADGRIVELRAGGALFYIPPEPHDSWVLGDEPYVSLHFLGADHYTRCASILVGWPRQARIRSGSTLGRPSRPSRQASPAT